MKSKKIDLEDIAWPDDPPSVRLPAWKCWTANYTTHLTRGAIISAEPQKGRISPHEAAQQYVALILAKQFTAEEIAEMAEENRTDQVAVEWSPFGTGKPRYMLFDVAPKLVVEFHASEVHPEEES
jgi:hypothetical protein